MNRISGIRGVCLDIDDTLSTRGKLTARAFEALWRLKDAGLAVVPITGRPAGWCDHMARFWPVDAVVGENGAFTFYMEEGVRKRIDTPMGIDGAQARAKLSELASLIQSEFSRVKWASDQAYREYDLAIDICEDVRPWPETEIQKLLSLCRNQGAHAKLSSIHVNTWFGNYDKKTGFEHWISQGAPGLSIPLPSEDAWVFVGDSPNDEPMFAHFRHSVGVANIRPYLSGLQYPPSQITQSESGEGFCELVDALLD